METLRTRLRRFTKKDLLNMIELESDEAVMRFTPSRVPQSRTKTEARLNKLVENEDAYAPLGVWAVEMKKTGEFVGWFMLVQGKAQFPELGFMVVKKYWGQGVATEVAERLLSYGFHTLHYSGITANTDADNVASIHVLKKLGFRQTGTTPTYDKINGRNVETVFFECHSDNDRSL